MVNLISASIKNDREEVEYPLRNILADKLVLRADFEDDLSGNKRRSRFWPNEREEKKKKRRFVNTLFKIINLDHLIQHRDSSASGVS